MLREGLKMSPDEGQEELEEVQAEIKKKDEEVKRISPLKPWQIRIHPPGTKHIMTTNRARPQMYLVLSTCF